MLPFSGFIRRRKLLKGEKGEFLAFEWSFLFMASIVIIAILLPDLFGIGRSVFYTHQAASFGIQKAVENGRMTTAIAQEMESYLQSVGVNEFEIYGSREDQVNNYGNTVDVYVSTLVRPHILQIMPDMRMSNTIAVEGGVVRITVHKVDVSTVYTRT